MSHSLPLFADLVLMVAVSLPVLFLFRRVGLPPVAGFVVTGMLIGPYGLGWIRQMEHVETAAEVGVVLLLFSIGLEVSLSRLLRTSSRLYAAAIGQIVGTTLAGLFVAQLLGLSMATSVVVGFILTLSSSAVVLKGLSDRGEVETPLGQLVVTTALAQDFAVVPMLLIIGFLSHGGLDVWAFGRVFLQVIALAGALYLAARYVLPPLITRLMTINTSEVVLLFTILVMLGTAWLTSIVGLSIAIGAFAAGLILSETEYYPQIYAEVAPFRSLFSSLFFVSVGMLLDLRFVAAHPLPVLFVATGVLLLKTVVVVAAAVPFGFTARMSLQAGFYLSQIGEFSFLLLGVAAGARLLGEREYQFLIAAAGLTLAITPLIMQWAPRLAWRAGLKLPWFGRGEEPVPSAAAIGSRPKPAVLIVGYGINGQNVSRVLRESSIYHEILDTNPELVRRSRDLGELVHFGDVTRLEVLKQIEASEFDSVVLAISDLAATRRAVSLIRTLNPTCHLIVRTRYVAEVEQLTLLGADVVVPEEFETSLRIFSELLHHYRVPPHIVAMQVELVRGHSYGMLRAKAESTVVDNLQELLLKRLVEAVPIPEGSVAVGRSLQELGLCDESGGLVISVLRRGLPLRPPYSKVVVEPDDLIVLYGNHVELDQAVNSLAQRK